jgi:hypothetical protein
MRNFGKISFKGMRSIRLLTMQLSGRTMPSILHSTFFTLKSPILLLILLKRIAPFGPIVMMLIPQTEPNRYSRRISDNARTVHRDSLGLIWKRSASRKICSPWEDESCTRNRDIRTNSGVSPFSDVVGGLQIEKTQLISLLARLRHCSKGEQLKPLRHK